MTVQELAHVSVNNHSGLPHGKGYNISEIAIYLN